MDANKETLINANRKADGVEKGSETVSKCGQFFYRTIYPRQS